MNISEKKLIFEISNLSFVLLEFCKKSEQTETIQGITSLVNCLYDKVEELYLKSNC